MNQINQAPNCLGNNNSFSNGMISNGIGSNSEYLSFKNGPLGLSNRSNMTKSTIQTKNNNVKTLVASELYRKISPNVRCIPPRSPKLEITRRNKSEVTTSKKSAQKSEASMVVSMTSTLVSGTSTNINLRVSPSSQNTTATLSANKSKRLSTKLSRDSGNFENCNYMRRTV